MMTLMLLLIKSSRADALINSKVEGILCVVHIAIPN